MDIDGKELTNCGVSASGDAVDFGLVDANGAPVKLTLPFEQAATLVMTLPALLKTALQTRFGDSSLRYVVPLGAWSIEGAKEGRHLIVTLQTPDGFEVSFGVMPDDSRMLAGMLTENAELCEAAEPVVLN
jgi:hypothetical protein